MLLRMIFAVATLLAFVASSFAQEPIASPQMLGETTEKARRVMAGSFHRQVCRSRVSAVQWKLA